MSVSGSAQLVTATHAQATAAVPAGAGRAGKAGAGEAPEAGAWRLRAQAGASSLRLRPRFGTARMASCERHARGSSLVPGAGRALWRGGAARPIRAGSARRRPCARRRRGLRGRPRELSLVLTTRPLWAEAARPHARLGTPRRTPACGAPVALCLPPWSSQSHGVGIRSQAEAAAAYPQCDLGASPSLEEFVGLTFKMGRSRACKVGLRRKFNDIQEPGTRGVLTKCSPLSSFVSILLLATTEQVDKGQCLFCSGLVGA